MVNNPLYPGYTPRKKDEEDISPLYPGYYPGKSMPKIPASKNYIKPVEFKAEEIMEEIDNAGRAVLFAPLAIPKWVKDRIVDDWKSKLKASIKPQGIELTELDDYDTVEFPGAAIDLSLNPKDWGVSGEGVDTRKTKKQLTKTLYKWVEETSGVKPGDLIHSNFSDIENKTNKKLWLHAMGYGNEDEMSVTDIVGGKAIAERTNAMFSGNSAPLDIKGVKAYEITEDGIGTKLIEDLYGETARRAANFAEQRDNPKTRELYPEFTREAFKSVNVEIKNALIKHSDDVGGTAMAKHSGAISVFDTGVKTMEDTYEIEKKISKGLGDIKKLKTNKKLGDTDIDTGVTKHLGEIGKEIKDRKAAWEKRQAGLTKLLENGEISEKVYADIKKSAKKYESFLEKADSAFSGGNEGEILKVLNEGKKLTKVGDMFDKTSAAEDLAKFCEYSLIRNKEGYMGGLLQDSDVEGAGVILKAKAIAPISYRLRQDKRRAAAEDFIDTFDKEGLTEKFVWSRVKDAMPEGMRNLASGKFITNTLEKGNYFGLIIKNPPKEGSLRHPGFNRKFGYRVSVDLDPKFFGTGNILIQGGGAFKILESNGILKSLGESGLLEGVLDIKNFGGKEAVELRELLAGKLLGKSLTSLSKEELGALDHFWENTEKYTKWVTEKFGDNLSKEQKLSLFKSLHAKNSTLNPGYKLDRKYIGRLEKIHNRIILPLQKKWESSIFGKTIKFASSWKNIISEKTAALLSKALAKLLGIAASTTGFLAVIMPWLEKILQKTIEKGLDYGTAFMKAVMKWDFDKLNEMTRKDFDKLMKSCLVMIAVIIFPVVLFCLAFLGVVGASISPIDPARLDTATGGQGEFAQPHGENDVVKITKDITVRLANGTVLENPPSLKNEEINGASFKYTIKITPKITITDGSVSFSDIGKDIGFSNTTVFLDIPTTPLNTFNAGEQIIIPTESFSFTSDYKDSMVQNTAFAYTPAVPLHNIVNPDTVSYSRYLRIGNYASKCPLTSGVGTRILTTSIANGDSTGHGSTSYWKNLAGFYKCTGDTPETCYAFAIPWSWYMTPCNRNNAPACKRGDDYYGYAMDVSVTDGSANGLVTFPPMDNPNIQWTVKARYDYGIVATSSDGWQLYLTHLDTDESVVVGKTFSAGATVGVLDRVNGGSIPHVHIELINIGGGGSEPVRPEDYFGSACSPS